MSQTPEDSGPDRSAHAVAEAIDYPPKDDDQDYVDRSKLDFDPADGLYSGTAVTGEVGDTAAADDDGKADGADDDAAADDGPADDPDDDEE